MYLKKKQRKKMRSLRNRFFSGLLSFKEDLNISRPTLD
jgi:hypothetical protein